MKKILLIGLVILGINTGCSNPEVTPNDTKSIKKNTPKTTEEYKKACKLGDGKACSHLAFMYSQGKKVEKP